MEDLAIILDARHLQRYGLAHAQMYGGTELLALRLASGLAARGHEVHVIAPDLAHAEHRGPLEWWWPPTGHPDVADVVVGVHGLLTMGDLDAPMRVLLANAIDPPGVDVAPPGSFAVACLSKAHVDLLRKARPMVGADQCYIVGAGVDLAEHRRPKGVEPVYGRMLWAQSPERGLWHMLDIFDRVQAAIPEASLHVTYDFEGKFAEWQWQANGFTELMWECRDRMQHTIGVVNLGAVSREGIVAEELACHVGVYPCDPPNVGSQLHGLTALELAACGTPLVLSDVEALPEVFGEVAEILPVPGSLRKHDKKRQMVGRFDAQDWADVVVAIMRNKSRYQRMSKAGKALAATMTWEGYLDRWESMLTEMIAKLRAPVAA